MAMKKPYWILLILFLCTTKANAWSGELLLDNCNDAIKILNNNGYYTNYNRAAEQFTNSGNCLGYIAATADLMGLDKNKSGFCPPIGATYYQFVRVTSKYLNKHPEDINMPASVLVITALAQAFPCPKASGK